MIKSRIIAGMVLMIFGAFLVGLTFFINEAKLVALIYGIPIFLLGIVIFLNKKEDVIEGVKATSGFL